MFSEWVALQALREINLQLNILREFGKNHVRPKELSIEAINSSFVLLVLRRDRERQVEYQHELRNV